MILIKHKVHEGARIIVNQSRAIDVIVRSTEPQDGRKAMRLEVYDQNKRREVSLVRGRGSVEITRDIQIAIGHGKDRGIFYKNPSGYSIEEGRYTSEGNERVEFFRTWAG